MKQHSNCEIWSLLIYQSDIVWFSLYTYIYIYVWFSINITLRDDEAPRSPVFADSESLMLSSVSRSRKPVVPKSTLMRKGRRELMKMMKMMKPERMQSKASKLNVFLWLRMTQRRCRSDDVGCSFLMKTLGVFPYKTMQMKSSEEHWFQSCSLQQSMKCWHWHRQSWDLRAYWYKICFLTTRPSAISRTDVAFVWLQQKHNITRYTKHKKEKEKQEEEEEAHKKHSSFCVTTF